MSTIDLVRMSKMSPEEFVSIRSRAARHLETLLMRGRNALTKRQFDEEAASAAAADFEALVHEEHPKLDTTGEVRRLVLLYYAMMAEAYKDIILLERRRWVDQLLTQVEPWQIASMRKVFEEDLP